MLNSIPKEVWVLAMTIIHMHSMGAVLRNGMAAGVTKEALTDKNGMLEMSLLACWTWTLGNYPIIEMAQIWVLLLKEFLPIDHGFQ
jgi:hypothetical protein